MSTGQTPAPKKETPPKPLNAQQQRFVVELCVDWNKAAAARRAGYSEKNAKQIGYSLWADQRVKAAVALRTEQLAMSVGEATVRMSGWGRSSIEDVFTIEVEEYRPRVQKPLTEVIAELKADMDDEQELAIRAEALLSDKKIMKKFRAQVARAHQRRQVQLWRYEKMLERNPEALTWVLGPPIAREVAQLDLVKALRAKAGGLIKKVTPTRFGTGVELHDAKDATDKILKLHGAYAPEKFDHTTKGQPLPGVQFYLPDNGRD